MIKINNKWYHRDCIIKILAVQKKYHVYFNTQEHNIVDVWKDEYLDDPFGHQRY